MPKLPPGTHEAAGVRRSDSTDRIIDRLARSPWRARITAWSWRRAHCPVETIALLGRGDRFTLRCLFELELYKAFLEDCGKYPARRWLTAARGIARFAVGDADAAASDLTATVRRPAGFGLWLRAASALNQIDPKWLYTELERRCGEPVAAFLLAHLADRAGDYETASRLLERHTLSGRRAAESDLLAANIAIGRGDRTAAQAAASNAFGRHGLCDFDARPQARDGALVSIIVAAFNAEQTIGAALQSLTAQSWRNLEILVVDDASSDATRARATAMAQQDSRIRVISRTVNEGAYVARNAGIAAARGDFVTFHDADDVAHPDRIARQIAPLVDDPALAFTTARWVRRTAEGKFWCRQILPLIRLHVGSMLVRRAFLAAVGPFDPVRFGADGDLLLRLRVAAGPMGFKALDLPLTIGGCNPHSAVHSPDTGYGAGGFSVARQEYAERRAWQLIEHLRGSERV